MESRAENIELQTIPIEELMQRLERAGINTTREEAELIMQFLHNLTCLVLRKYFEVP